MRHALLILSSILAAGTSAAHDRSHDPPLRIRFLAPDAGHLQGLTTPTGWALVIRIDAPAAVAIVETAEPGDTPQSRREAIVLTDPDGCLDMRHFPISVPAPYHDCGGADETFLEFTTERFDSFDELDSNTGNFVVRRDWLVDGAPNAAPPLVLVNRPQTGGDLLDGYGFGPDDDLPGLVILSDLGAARVFNASFELSPGSRAVRNLAGFVNSVAQELLTKRGGSALTAWLHVAAGMFEPIAIFDLDVEAAGVDYQRRLESGPVKSFTFGSPPTNDDALLAEISSSYSPYTLDVRAVLVEGIAPAVIYDRNGDGRFTAADLKLMGHKVLSNEARLRQVIHLDVLATETLSRRTCPPASQIYRDLDGNGRNGREGVPACSGSGGAARIRGVPR